VAKNEMHNQDEAERKKFLEEQVKEFIPVGIDVELTIIGVGYGGADVGGDL